MQLDRATHRRAHRAVARLLLLPAHVWLWAALAAAAPAVAEGAARPDSAPSRAVSALGRLEPRDGIFEVSGPSTSSVVIADLRVEEGDRVQQGDVIAILDSHALYEAEVQRFRAQLANAQRELERVRKMSRSGVSTDARFDAAQLDVQVAEADLAHAEAQLAMSIVRSPVSGQVLKIHARDGERVGAAGIAEVGRTDEMCAVAEVYETDIGLVKPGQRARLTSPALSAPLEGEVERIGLKVGKLDLLDTDPAARTDARVVEVLIRLDDGADVAGLTNLQVRIEIQP